MPQFKNRDEYERWKADREAELRKQSAPRDTAPAAPHEPGAEPPPEPTGVLPGDPACEPAPIDQLLNGSWMVYRRRIGVMIGLSVFAVFLPLFVLAFFAGIAYSLTLLLESAMIPLLVGGATSGALGAILVFCWGQAAIVFAVTDESLGFGAALASGWNRLWDFIWLYSAAGFIILGGFMLAVVPGVILLVWFSFAQFLLAEGKEKGMRSLLKSKAYIQGIWGPVFLRLFVVWLISVGVGSLPFIGSLFSILFMPFMTIYVYLTYESVKACRGDVWFEDTVEEKAKWIGVGVAGHLVPLVILALLWPWVSQLCPLVKESLAQSLQ